MMKLWTTVYPPNKARIGAKLRQNAFQTICNFSFFDPEKTFWIKFFQKFSRSIFFQGNGVLEKLWFFFPRWHVRRKKLLPVVHLFLGRLPWRRGKQLNMCRQPRLGTENDFNHLVLWFGDSLASSSAKWRMLSWQYWRMLKLQHLQIGSTSALKASLH